MTKYYLYLGFAQILGDFYFQTEKLATEKEKKYTGVLKHSVEYLLVSLALALLVPHPDMIIAAFLTALAHAIIDSLKYILIRKRVFKNSWNTFWIDQVAHLISILLMAFFMFRYNFVVNTKILDAVSGYYSFSLDSVLRWILVLLILHKPSNILIQKFLAEYKPIGAGTDMNAIIATKNAGIMIGTIERIIMIILIAIGQYSALGLVLTAKSITRYNKIVNEKDFAEYYLLGTLLSFLCVLLASVLI